MQARGTARSAEECHLWNRFLLKLGWRDERSAVLPQRIQDSGLTGKPSDTIIDHIEYDEGRDPVAERAWEKIRVGIIQPQTAKHVLYRTGSNPVRIFLFSRIALLRADRATVRPPGPTRQRSCFLGAVGVGFHARGCTRGRVHRRDWPLYS